MRLLSFPTKALVFAFVLNGFGLSCLAQKNGNDRRDEQRENERVRNAEREVSQARKRISEIQNDLKSQLRRFDSAKDKVSKSKATVREAREAAESELGVKLGFPESLAVVREKRQIFDELCKPVLDRLHESPEWKKLESEAASAKAILASLREDVELSEEELAQKTKALNDVIFRTFASENQALQANEDCLRARKELDEASERLQELRKKLTTDAVNSHRLVIAASKTFAEVEKQFLSIDREIANTRGAVAKAQRVLQQAISALAKAKQDDASDKNNRAKKN
jgi:chromosome segregation ATPase